MKGSSRHLNVFLEAIEHELELLRAIGTDLERSDAVDATYMTVAETYARLRNARADALVKLGWSNADKPLTPFVTGLDDE